MELDDLRSAWVANDSKLEKRLKINEQKIELIQSQTVSSWMKSLYRQRMIETIFHAIVILLLLAFLYANFFQFPYAVSAITLLAFYIVIFINAFRQIKLINKIDYNKDLATLQSTLVTLQTHIVNYARLSVLFIPCFLSYPVILTKVIKDYHIKAFGDFDIIAKSNGNWWTAQIAAFIVLIPLGIWFFKEITYKNMHKKWVKNFIQKSSGKSVAKALDFLKELQNLKHDIH